MRERSEQILKIVCGVLAAFLLFQLVRLVIHTNPLRGVRMPELPTLTGATEVNPGAKGTNVVAGSGSRTNATNAVSQSKSDKKGTNAGPTTVAGKTETNAPPGPVTPPITNTVTEQAAKKNSTNSVSAPAADKSPTNAAATLASGKSDTNSSSARRPPRPGVPPFGSESGGAKLAEIPPIIQARMDRITQSELLAPFMRPMPMALLGIAGRDAFLRSPSGQTGLVKEGDELGGIKLLQIGINRVLVEQEGEKKELIIFAGLGSESLLPKPKPATNETITPIK